MLLPHTKWKTLYVCYILIWEQIDQRNLHYAWIHKVATNFRDHSVSFERIHRSYWLTVYLVHHCASVAFCFIHTAHSSKLHTGTLAALMKHKGSQNSDTDTTTFQCISIAEAAEKDRLNRERKARNQRRYYQKYVDSTFLKAFRSIYWACHLVTKQSNNAKHDSRPVSKYLKSQSSHPYNPIFLLEII